MNGVPDGEEPPPKPLPPAECDGCDECENPESKPLKYKLNKFTSKYRLKKVLFGISNHSLDVKGQMMERQIRIVMVVAAVPLESLTMNLSLMEMHLKQVMAGIQMVTMLEQMYQMND